MSPERAGTPRAEGRPAEHVGDGSAATVAGGAVDVGDLSLRWLPLDTDCPDCRAGRGWAVRCCGLTFDQPNAAAAIAVARRIKSLFPDQLVELHVPGCDR